MARSPTCPDGSAPTSSSTSTLVPHRRNLQVVGPHRTERVARRVPENAAGALRRVRAATPAVGWATGTPRRQPRTDVAATDRSCCTPDGSRERPGNCRRARHRTADQLRDNLLRPSPPGGAARRAATGLSEFHLDVPGNLGATAVSQPGRGTRRGGGPSRGARRFVGCQRCLRRTRSATRLVPRHRTRCDRGRWPACITHHPVPTAWELGSGAVLFDPRGRRCRCDPTVTARGWDRRAHLAHRGPHRSARSFLSFTGSDAIWASSSSLRASS